MTSKSFIDTNILVYALDAHDPQKQNHCRGLLKSLSRQGTGVLSTQVLQEFYVIVTRKLGVDPLATKDLLISFERFELVTVTSEMIKEAIDCSIINIVSFWDALIVVSAQSARCRRIYTEDLNHGQVMLGVQIENPFDAAGVDR